MEPNNANRTSATAAKDVSKEQAFCQHKDGITLNKTTLTRELISAVPKEEEDLSYLIICTKLVLSGLPAYITLCIIYLNGNIVFYYLKTHNSIQVLGAYGLAISLINMISTAVITALNEGLISRASQAYGAKNSRLVGLCFHRALIINSILFIPCALLLYFSDEICLMMKYEAQTAYYVQKQLSLSIPAIFILMVFNTMSSYLNACKIFGAPAVTGAAGTFLFWISAYFTIEKENMGVAGAALSFNIMYVFCAMCLFVYIKWHNPAPGTFFFFHLDSFKELWSQFKYELLVGSMIYLEWTHNEIIVLLAGTLSTVEYAALGIVNANIALLYSFPVSFAGVVLSHLGNAVGEKNERKVKRILKAAVLCISVVVLFVEIYLGFFTRTVMKLYVNDPATVAQAVRIMRLYMIQIPFEFLQIVLSSGLRAIGKERTGTVIMLVTYYCVGLPTSVTFCYVVKWGVEGLMIGPIVSQIVLVTVLLIIYSKVDLNKQYSTLV